MSKVNFPCPFCGQKMAVGSASGGKKVRCPHCKEVLVAPSAEAPPAVAVPAVAAPDAAAPAVAAPPKGQPPHLARPETARAM